MRFLNVISFNVYFISSNVFNILVNENNDSTVNLNIKNIIKSINWIIFLTE